MHFHSTVCWAVTVSHSGAQMGLRWARSPEAMSVFGVLPPETELQLEPRGFEVTLLWARLSRACYFNTYWKLFTSLLIACFKNV